MGGNAVVGGGGAGGSGGVGGVPLPDCNNPDVTYIYLMTSSQALYAYKPQSNQVEYRGQVGCPTFGGSPFSMAVSRIGEGYVVYSDGVLYRVDLTDASCEATPFVPNQQGFETFGMGFALDDDMMGETLYVSDIDYAEQTTKGLGAIDLDTFELSVEGSLQNPLGFRIEVTGRGTELYAFIIDGQVGGGHLAEVDKQTGTLSNIVAVPIGNDIGSWHFAFWGGYFYFFTESNNSGVTQIRRYDPTTMVLEQVGTVPEPVVGAGASTCAPATL